jgi:hypothetical protein
MNRENLQQSKNEGKEKGGFAKSSGHSSNCMVAFPVTICTHSKASLAYRKIA